MSSLGYGMYGYGVLNVNGETDQLPVCRLSSASSGSLPTVVQFAENASDDYLMAVPNQSVASGYWSVIRTLVSGLYEIQASVVLLGGAGAGNARLNIYVDKTVLFNSNGVPTINPYGFAYSIADERAVTPAATRSTAAITRTVFLEKDCYLFLYASAETGTAPTVESVTASCFSVRCLAAENSGKYSNQT